MHISVYVYTYLDWLSSPNRAGRRRAPPDGPGQIS
jgi:hypothetical protein